MRQGITDRFLAGNLRWSADGSVLATWQLTALMRPRIADVAAAVHLAHTELYRAVVGHDFVIQGLLTWTDEDSLIGKMIDGVDLESNPAWADECLAARVEFDDIPFARRRWYLTVKLKTSARSMVTSSARAGFNKVCETAGLTLLPPTADELRQARRKAQAIQNALPRVFQPRPATEAEMVWARLHAQARSSLDMVDPADSAELAEELLEVSGRAAVGEPFLDPNGLTDLDKPNLGTKLAAPLQRRWLKVVTDTEATSYQVGLVLAKVPAAMHWPTSEFLGRIDDTGVPMDIAIAGTVKSRHTAMLANKRAMHNLNDQLEQVDQADASGSLTRLFDAAQLVEEYQTELQRDPQEVEVQPIIMVSTAASTPEGADELARDFIDADAWDEFTWARPVGAEEDIFWAMQPGQAISPQVKQYQQITASASLGATSALLSHDLGADKGIPFAINRTSGLESLVFLDLFGETRDKGRNVSPSLAIVGEQGGGKSSCQKTICSHYNDRGARFIATDNSDEREWITFAESCRTTAGIVDFADPTHSADPLRTMPAHMAGPVVQSFLSTLLDLNSMEGPGKTLGKVVQPTYLTEHKITSLGGLQRHLAAGCRFDHAEDLGDRIGAFSELDGQADSFGRAIFDPDLPALDMNSRAIVFGTSNVQLPSAKEVEIEHLYKSLPLSKRLGRAVYALIAVMAHQVCFADRSDEAIFNVDELHHLTTSTEATTSVAELIRFGRRGLAGCVLSSHDSDDFSSSTLLGLIKNRLVLRTSDETIAGRAAHKMLGIDPDKDPEQHAAMVEDITKGLAEGNGAGIFRDSRQRLGRIQTLRPSNPVRRAAVDTTPPEKAGI